MNEEENKERKEEGQEPTAPQHSDSPEPESPESRPGEYTAAPGAIRGESSSSEETPTPGAESPSPPQQPPPPPKAVRPPQAPPPRGPQPPRPPQQQQPPRQAPPPPPQRPLRPYGGQPSGRPPQGVGPPPPPRTPYGPPSGMAGGPRPGGVYGGPPKQRNRMIPLIAGIIGVFVILGIFLVGIIFSATGSSSTGTGSGFSFWGDQVAVLEINGAIMEDQYVLADTARLTKQIRTWAENDSIKAMVLRINSPGGAVSATQDLFFAIQEFRDTGKPVVTSMGDVAASGGFYAAMASDEVYANEGTLTGSVGVILNFLNYQGLEQKIGIDSRPVKSGEFKDIGSGSREMTEEEKELLKEMVVDVFEQFFEVVFEGRKEQVREKIASERGHDPSQISDAEVKAYIAQYTDGRIFSGRQAVEYGLIDGNKTLQEVIEHAKSLANLTESATVVKGPARPQQGLFGSMSSLANKAESAISHPKGKISMEYRLY